MGLQYVTTGNLAPYIKTFGAGFEFVVISGLLSGLIASLFIYVADKVTFKLPEINNNIIYASGLFIIAIITTYTL
jgi:hypothetical protein